MREVKVLGRGFKGLGSNLNAYCGNNMEYEIGKWYTIKGRLISCFNGYHFSKKLEDVLSHYTGRDGDRYFEIEYGDEEFEISYNKCVTRSIRIIREISKEEIHDILINKINCYSISSFEKIENLTRIVNISKYLRYNDFTTIEDVKLLLSHCKNIKTILPYYANMITNYISQYKITNEDLLLHIITMIDKEMDYFGVLSIMKNNNSTERVIKKLLLSKSASARMATVESDKTSASIILSHIDDEYSSMVLSSCFLNKNVQQDKDIASKIIEKILIDKREKLGSNWNVVVNNIASSENTNSEFIDRIYDCISNKSNCENIRFSIAENGNTSVDTLYRMLALEDKDYIKDMIINKLNNR